MNRELPSDIRRLIASASTSAQLREGDDVTGAVAHWRRAIELLPGDRTRWRAYSGLWGTIGDALYEAGDDRGAAEAYRAALNGAGVDEAYVRFMLGKALCRIGDLDRAIVELLSVYALDGDDMFADDFEGYAMWRLVEPSLIVAA